MTLLQAMALSVVSLGVLVWLFFVVHMACYLLWEDIRGMTALFGWVFVGVSLYAALTLIIYVGNNT